MKKLFSEFKDRLYAETYYEQTVTVYSDREVMIENVRRVIESNEICIRIATYLGETTIWGNNLCIESCKGTTVKIKGTVTSCEIVRRSK